MPGSTGMITLLAGGDASWNPLHFDPGTTALSFITFLIVLFILKKLAWGPLVQAVEDREKKIEGSLKAAEEAQAGAEEARQAVENEMRQARAEAQAIIEESREAAQKVGREIEEKARTESEALRERAQQEIALATQQARESIRKEAVDMALKAASAVVGRSLEESDHQRIAEEVIKDMAEA